MIYYCLFLGLINTTSIFMIFRTIVLGSFAICYLMSNMLRLYLLDMDSDMNGFNADKTLTQLIENHSSDYRWALKMTVNCIGYCCIFLPGILIYHYAHKIKYFDRCGKKMSSEPSWATKNTLVSWISFIFYFKFCSSLIPFSFWYSESNEPNPTNGAAMFHKLKFLRTATA